MVACALCEEKVCLEGKPCPVGEQVKKSALEEYGKNLDEAPDKRALMVSPWK